MNVDIYLGVIDHMKALGIEVDKLSLKEIKPYYKAYIRG